MPNNKRAAGEGSKITYRPREGRWYARLSFGFKNGKRLRKSFYGATVAEVREKILKARSDHASGLPVLVKRQTLAQFLEQWLREVVKSTCRPRTYESYELTVRLHIVPMLGKIRPEKLMPQQVQTLLNRKAREGNLSPRSVAYIRG